YHLYRAVEQTKLTLSASATATLAFHDPPADIDAPVARGDFEGWIGAKLAAIDGCVDRLLAQTGASPADVDQVFLTGGSSLVPAVRARFAARFGAAKLRGGDELTSVAQGLALRARDLVA